MIQHPFLTLICQRQNDDDDRIVAKPQAKYEKAEVIKFQ